MLRPTLRQSLRPMISPNYLETHNYEMEIVDFSSGSNNQNAIEVKNLKKIELHPLEWDGLVVLYNPKKDKELRIEIPVGNITDIQLISEKKGHIIKKENLMIQIIYKSDRDNQDNNIVVIDLDDKRANECFRIIQSMRQKELGGQYWTHRLLTFQTSSNNNNQTKTIDIYPLARFLAEGEDIIWHQMKIEGRRDKKVQWIQALTNYRVFHYDFIQHAGTFVLLPGLEDVVVNNQRRTSRSNSVGFYSRSYYNLSGFSSSTGNSMTIGDVVFIALGRPFIIFRQIGDPHGFASVVKSIRKQTHVRIGEQVQTGIIREEQTGRTSQIDNKMQVTQTKTVTPNINIVNTIICNKCGNDTSPKGSKFCNKCGSKLQNNCANCGNVNPENSAFCNQCGFALT